LSTRPWKFEREKLDGLLNDSVALSAEKSVKLDLALAPE
jgi:hypothetical protein